MSHLHKRFNTLRLLRKAALIEIVNIFDLPPTSKWRNNADDYRRDIFVAWNPDIQRSVLAALARELNP